MFGSRQAHVRSRVTLLSRLGTRETSMLGSQQWWQVTLASVGDAVMATDTNARIVFLNPAAEELTGWSLEQAQGRPIGDVFVILDEQSRRPAENPALRALAEGRIQGLANHTILIARDGSERGIDDSAAPIRDENGSSWASSWSFATSPRNAKRTDCERRGSPWRRSSRRGSRSSSRRSDWSRRCRERSTGMARACGWSNPGRTGSPAALPGRRRRAACWRGSRRIVPPGSLAARASSVAPGNEANRSGWATERRSSHPARTDAAVPAPTANRLRYRRLPAVPAGALAAPLTIEGENEGVLVLWHHARQHRDQELAETVATLAAQIGDFIQRRRVQLEIRRHEAELDDFFRSAVVGLHWVGPDGIIQRANRAELEMLGYAGVGVRRPPRRRVPRRRGSDRRDARSVAARRGSARQEVRLRAKDGSIRHAVIDSNGRWEDGRFIHSRCFTRDVTDRKNAEINLRFLHQSSQTLAELVDYRTTLERIAQLAVPDFADWCTVQIARPERHRAGGMGPPRPGSSRLVREAFERHPIDPDSDYGIAMVLRTGKSELVRVITDEMLVRAARTESHLQLLRELRLSSSMTVPLTAKQGAAAPSASSPRSRDAATPRPISRPPRTSPSRRRSPSTTHSSTRRREKPIGARTSSSPRSRTSSAIRWRRSAAASTCWRWTPPRARRRSS